MSVSSHSKKKKQKTKNKNKRQNILEDKYEEISYSFGKVNELKLYTIHDDDARCYKCKGEEQRAKVLTSL